MSTSGIYLDELLDCVAHATSPCNCLDNRRKIIIHQYDRRGFSRDFSPSNTHRKPYICGLQCGPIIGAVTSDRNYFTTALKAIDEYSFVFRTSSGEDLQPRNNGAPLMQQQIPELRAVHDFTVSIDATFSGDSLGGGNIVSRHHANDYAGFTTVGDRFCYTRPK